MTKINKIIGKSGKERIPGQRKGGGESNGISFHANSSLEEEQELRGRSRASFCMKQL